MNSTSIDSLSTFSTACGAGALHLNLFGGDGRLATRRRFDSPFCIVGRSPDADLRIDDDQVSWRHCYLQVIDGRLVAIDLDSQEGVLIDGEAQRIGWAGQGSRLQIGPFTLELEGKRDEGRETDAARGTPLHPLSAQFARDLPPAALEIEGAGGPTYGWRMSRALALIGRSTACQVRLMNQSVSKFHAALVRTPAGVWVVDLLSREGITVDGVNVRAARLEVGSVCQVGTFTLRLSDGVLAPAPPRPGDRGRLLPVASPPQAVNRSLKAHAPAVAGPAPLANGRSVILATPVSVPASAGWAPNPSPTYEAVYRPAWNQPAEPAPSAASPGADSTQQAMLMLAQMLGTMHRDHMSLVKDELAEIRKLAEEMHALRVEIGQRGLARDESPASAPAAVTAPQAAAAASEAPAPAPVPAPAAASSTRGAAAVEPAPEEAPPARDPRDCLAIASQFLAAYERKQEGHWSKILRAVTGLARGQDAGRGPLEQAPLG